ncbi:MAG TPA: hypothetical protein VGX78_09870 [Pirellulales bacterium]|nr:hypothetical protein [Pirellulales bacterium]
MEEFDWNDRGGGDCGSDDHDPLDGLIADYLAARLDPQQGRASSAFRISANDGPFSRPGPLTDRRWLVVTAAVAAASLLVVIWIRRQPAAADQGSVESFPLVVAGQSAPRNEAPTSEPGEVHVERVAVTARAEPRLLEEVVRFRTLDEGIVVIDGRRPVRKLRRQWFQRVAWFDASTGARLERIVPREELVYVDIPVN